MDVVKMDMKSVGARDKGAEDKLLCSDLEDSKSADFP